MIEIIVYESALNDVMFDLWYCADNRIERIELLRKFLDTQGYKLIVAQDKDESK